VGVEACRHLVQHGEPWLSNERQHDGQALLLPAG
jgi:hypothetical protein